MINICRRVNCLFKPCRLCFLGDRLLTLSSVSVNGTMWCTKNESGPIYHNYCSNNGTYCDPFFLENNVSIIPGMPGIASGHFISMQVVTYTCIVIIKIFNSIRDMIIAFGNPVFIIYYIYKYYENYRYYVPSPPTDKKVYKTIKWSFKYYCLIVNSQLV